MAITGRCHCGFVTYEVEIDPGEVSICHCTDCQRLTGSPYRVTAPTHRDRLRLTGNAPNLYLKVGDNGRTRLQYFCPRCGSPLFTTGTEEDAETWGIRWGSIDQRRKLRPRSQIWCRSATDWFGETAVLPGMAED
ncbi:GFA family protein [Rhizobium sp. TRM95111]|uniref:GFA family protein n=1 Tax=Rhizobium alarense TaxID=2846851 RepID=UPI001F24755E|nr:GFA family protein [Rhizobium alarense]MCF3642831.1 GFA family protein [Rhizobium alarense]